jgi:hypothetical protein
MRYNDVIEDPVVVSVSGSEPVTLTEVKRHLNLQFDTSGSYQFNDDDTYLTDLITQARNSLEKYTGLSFLGKDLKCIVRNECGGIEIPYGPIVSVTKVSDKDGNDITSTTTIRGISFKWIESPCLDYLIVEFSAGYADGQLPAALKRAHLEEIAFRYVDRGDATNRYAQQEIGISQGAMNLAAPFKRTSWVA